ncbi:MAG TPA: hypothetical protein VH370_04705 [Humisphaera sp.]|jgi:hypothetical protein|nr:hypothetical protein [Humisphaera sp.]
MSDDEPNKPPPLEYATPRDLPQEGWTTPRIFAGIFGALPGGLILGLVAGGFACWLMAWMRSATVMLATVLMVAVWLGSLAYRTKVVARLFFLGATIGALMVCLLIGICGR